MSESWIAECPMVGFSVQVPTITFINALFLVMSLVLAGPSMLLFLLSDLSAASGN